MADEQTDFLVLANWKANFAPQRAYQWCDTFAGSYRPLPGVEVVIAVPALCMLEVAARLGSLPGVALAAQGVSSYPQGSYTGATPAAWLRGLARYSLLGHRERRHYFHETVQDVARQVAESLAEEVQPIVCVDQETARSQAAIFDTEDLLKIHWAYTPQDAEQLERSHSARAIEETVASLGRAVGNQPMLYGGGVGPQNGAQLASLAGISGLLVGRECLDAQAFVQLLNQLPLP
ncbi:triose-phosphate isomerase [Desulfogranum mediterraneum]|uniref:triose-phosphate isomerase n=1 Tax=Desulfogranum mediterraneum TaxID=160661 RepID=UPI0012946E2D|nr:triose-phosphate isomerase family protein [Desulfogranum mediterraneum]